MKSFAVHGPCMNWGTSTLSLVSKASPDLEGGLFQGAPRAEKLWNPAGSNNDGTILRSGQSLVELPIMGSSWMNMKLIP